MIIPTSYEYDNIILLQKNNVFEAIYKIYVLVYIYNTKSYIYINIR